MFSETTEVKFLLVSLVKFANWFITVSQLALNSDTAVADTVEWVPTPEPSPASSSSLAFFYKKYPLHPLQLGVVV